MNAPASLTPATIEDYANAVEAMPSGQFMGRFYPRGRLFFALMYGAPFYALSRLAPEYTVRPSISLLMGDPIGTLASDGGRWLSLYMKAKGFTAKVGCTVCAPTRPRSSKPAKPLLFQPIQQVLTKSWGDHLDQLDTPPDLLILPMLGVFEEYEAVANELCRRWSAHKALLAFDARVEAIAMRALLQALGCQTSEVLGFDQSPGKPRHFGPGAWWISATPPAEPSDQSGVELDTDDLRRACEHYWDLIRPRALTEEDAGTVAAVYATRTTETVAGEPVQAVWLAPDAGIDLASGRYFSRRARDPEAGFDWDGRHVGASRLAPAPEFDPTRPPDEDRLQSMRWLGKILARDDAGVVAAGLDDEPVLAPAPVDKLAAAAPEAVDGMPAGHAEAVSLPDVPPPVEMARPALEVVPPPVGHALASPQRRARLSRSAGTVNVLALAARLGRTGQGKEAAFDAARERILAWLGHKGFTVANPTTNSFAESTEGEVSIETDGAALWALRFDDRRSMKDGAIWRVEATVLGPPEPAISVRLIQVRSSEDAPPPVASGVPSMVATLARDIGLEDAGIALNNAAVRLSGEKGARALIPLLLNAHRTQAVIVIAGGVDKSADRLAARLVGVAHVVCVDDIGSQSLIRALGRERSVYGHAVRLYRPGFSLGEDSYQHPVWPLKGTQLPVWLNNEIFEEACAISLEVGDLDERAPPFQAVRRHLAEQRLSSSEQRLATLRRQAEGLAASKDEQIHRLEAINAELESTLADHRASHAGLADQVEQLRGELQATRRERDEALEEARRRRYQWAGQWEQVAALEPQGEEQAEYPETWDDLETWVELYGQDRLVLHPKAAKATRESPFKDIPLAYKAMDYLVRYYVPMRTRDKGDTEVYRRSQQALAELGLEESDVGTADEIRRYKKEYQRQYEGETITLDRHLKRGVGFGGDFQFRLYFYFDEKAAKVLVGHMPTHLTNRLSHNG